MKDRILDKEGRKKHSLILHGWPGDKSYCDYSKWWDCSFWCTNNKLFGKKTPTERFCPMTIPKHENCPIIKAKARMHVWRIKHDDILTKAQQLFYEITGLEISHSVNKGITEILRHAKK